MLLILMLFTTSLVFAIVTGVCEINTLFDSGVFLHAATPLP